MRTKDKSTLLVIDDDEDVLLSAKMLLKGHYERILTLEDPKQLNQVLSTEAVDLILLDMNYRLGINDGKEGLYWLEHIRSINPGIVVILMTAYGEVELAVNAIKKGAFDFILKPWTNEKFLATVQAGIRFAKSDKTASRLKFENEALRKQEETERSTVIGTSDQIKDLIKLIEKVSQTDASVLILGENGTGKQHFARQIHQRSARSDGPFIHVDLGAITETLFESELFGHKRGSFTDAIEDKPGLFELAQHGTLFLDEVANLSYKLQAKLLTALQEKKTSRIGEGKQRPFDSRLLFATNANLYEMVEEGSFRQDLLFRINTVELQIPPLRERLADVKEFAEHFLHIYSERYGKPHLKLSAEAMDSLVTHGWPGNIREIQHTIERGVIMAEGSTIEPADFSLTKTSKKGDTDLDTLNLHELEKMLVLKALEKHNSNISKAAKELGITRAALYRRMEKFNI